mmetsp:Transcript_2073/g.2986  ORF Transcript_2073/g.2986 Transcript_2073/m.2986 type:complete len:346 (+) Transcript_2073:65-1102(+)
MKQFNAIRMDFYHQINQWYLFEKDGEQMYCIESDRNDVEEGHIVTLLQQNNNRIKMNEVGLKYKSMFNAEMPIPEGMKLFDWFGKCKKVDVEFDSQSNQTYLVLRPLNDLTKEEEKHILHILEHNNGCIAINDMVKIFKESHKRDITFVEKDSKSGKKMKLLEWLCSLNSLVLTRKPFKNQIFVALKHDVQCKYDSDVAQSTQNKEIRTEVASDANRFKNDTSVEANNFEATPTPTSTVSGTARGDDRNSSKICGNSTEILTKRKRNREDRHEHQNGVSVKKENDCTLSPNKRRSDHRSYSNDDYKNEYEDYDNPYCNELLMYGVKPWDNDADAVLDCIHRDRQR